MMRRAMLVNHAWLQWISCEEATRLEPDDNGHRRRYSCPAHLGHVPIVRNRVLSGPDQSGETPDHSGATTPSGSAAPAGTKAGTRIEARATAGATASGERRAAGGYAESAGRAASNPFDGWRSNRLQAGRGRDIRDRQR